MGLIENWDRTRLIVQSCGAPLVADAMAAGQVVVRSHFIETRNGALELERILRGAVERVGITIGGSEQLDAILVQRRSEEHTSELQSLMRISYAVFCLKKKKYKERSKDTNKSYKQSNE